MRKLRDLICMCLVLILLATTSMGADLASAPEASGFAPGEVIVGFEEITAENIGALKARGGTIIKEISALEAVVVRVTVGNEEEFIQSVSSIAGVKYAERNGIIKAVYTPNDPYWGSLWNMKIIEADDAWDIHKGSTSVVVAIADTGIDYKHEDLAAHYVSGGYDWANSDTDPWDDHGHGTHCAGIVAAVMDNKIGVVGVAQVSLWAEKVLDETGSGYWDWLADGIIHATDNGIDVISMSLGGYGYSKLVDDACSYAWTKGVLLSAAAGNDNQDIGKNPFYPACYEPVIAVSATTNTDAKADYSNYGDPVELAAPGGDSRVPVFSTFPGNNYGNMYGTSMSCPHVAGIAALTWSYEPSLTNQQLRDHLHTAVKDLGTPGKDIYFGYGRIDAYKALTTITPPLPYHFLIDGYIDELWLNFNPDGTVNGIDDAEPYYTAPILGLKGKSGMLLFIDFPTGSGTYELMMMMVSFPSLSATGYLTADGLTVYGPDSYQLIYVPSTEVSEGSEGKVLAAGAEATEVNPALVGFYLKPFIDEVYLGSFAPGKLNGYADVPGHHCYPAPILGILGGSKLIFAMDYKTDPGCYELGMVVLDRPELDGNLYRTSDGLSIIGPTYVWLERMTSTTTDSVGDLQTSAQCVPC